MKLMWRGAVAPTPELDAQRMIHAGRLRDRITTNVSSKFPAQAGRYRFYAHGVQHRGQRPAPHRPFQARLECHNRTARHTAHAGPGARLRCRVGGRRPQLIEDIKATPRQPGIEEIRIPSERAFRSRERALREGLNIDRLVFDSLVALRARPR